MYRITKNRKSNKTKGKKRRKTIKHSTFFMTKLENSRNKYIDIPMIVKKNIIGGGDFTGEKCSCEPYDTDIDIFNLLQTPIDSLSIIKESRKHASGAYNDIIFGSCDKCNKLALRILRNSIKKDDLKHPIVSHFIKEYSYLLTLSENDLAPRIYLIGTMTDRLQKTLLHESPIPADSQDVYLFSIMERGVDYEITLDNIEKAIKLFEKLSRYGIISIDIKPENLLMIERTQDPSHIVLIDTDPHFLLQNDIFRIPFSELHSFGSSLMKYLFCMYLLIAYNASDISEDIIEYLLSILQEISSHIFLFSYENRGNKDVHFLDIISLFYNHSSNIFKDHYSFFVNIINSYHFNSLSNFIRSSYSPSLFLKYIRIRNFLVNCSIKVKFEQNMIRKYIHENIKVKFDEETNTMIYTINGKEIKILSITKDILIYSDDKDEHRVNIIK